MNNVISFNEALEISKNTPNRYLLLGNGFSTSLFPNIFSYHSLLDQADFTQKFELKSIFEKLGTSDFEKVIRAIEYASIVNQCYGIDSNLVTKLNKAVEDLKEILITTITSNHPKHTGEVSEAKKNACGAFLNHFKKIYTLNYDTLLYWVLLHTKSNRINVTDDGFRTPDDNLDSDYRVFSSQHSPTFFFLHGSLHIFDTGNETIKYIWADTGIPIIDQVRRAIENRFYPLFVAEGSSVQKMTRINHSGYLSKAIRSFEGCCNTKNADLFIFGHSLNDTDDHILEIIRKSTIKRCFISAYKGSQPNYEPQYLSRAYLLNQARKKKSPLEIIIFDAPSANVWGENSKL